MTYDSGVLTFLFYLFSAIIVAVLVLLFYRRRKHELLDHKRIKMAEFILDVFPDIESNTRVDAIDRDLFLFIEQYIQLQQSLVISEELRLKILDYLVWRKRDRHYIKRLRSISRFRRTEAATVLGYFIGADIHDALVEALSREKHYSIRLFFANALADIGQAESIPHLIASLVGAPEWYQKKIHVSLAQFGQLFYRYIPAIIHQQDKEIESLIIHFAAEYVAEDLKDYLIEKTGSDDTAVSHAAIGALSHMYPMTLDSEQFLTHPDPGIRIVAVKALGRQPSQDTIIRLLRLLGDEEIREAAILAVSEILLGRPKHISLISKRFRLEQDQSVRSALAQILANRIEYFLVNITGRDRLLIKDLLKDVLLLHQTSNVIGFLNRNHNREIENEILIIVREVGELDQELLDEFRTYLDDRILKKLKQDRLAASAKKKDEKREKIKLFILYTILFCAIVSFPGLYLLRRGDMLGSWTFTQHLTQYVIDINYYLAYYFASTNGINLLLLLFSLIGVVQQANYWRVKKLTTMFKNRMLPSITIIAPAYCEEASILESTNSLLNLQYPDYELIVVNDGSGDQTLNSLIDYYHLERVDYVIDTKIETMPVRGVYINKALPKLKVVDKTNGGKADSLNVGINISNKEYFCGIDADSLLESDALLKVTSPILDSDEESIASGGNILPVNGCAVDKGMLTSIGMPTNQVARYQTIEYLRAFMAGRVGWSYINSLLIISGAFGLFKKDRVIEAGGYLTSMGQFQKDTVGEDMELVVRLSRHMRSNKIKHRIHYAYNANCWTEVPEDMDILGRQRDRWHRGLIDILIFHRKLLFNPNFGRVGLVAMPYFFIFECIGPLFEVQGYVMVILAAILGLLNAKLALFLFVTAILMGVVVSVFSLLMAGEIVYKFRKREILMMIFYAIIENFGFRQISSFWRFTGFINSMKRPKGWGKMVRKGFASKA
ncbi:HEAT repeat domain-containing protein [Candidatus Neomarinimicrobiota bacterium]